MVGRKLLNAVAGSGVFAQQYDPFTAEPSVNSTDYGPTALALLEYITLMFGVAIDGEFRLWSGVGTSENSTYRQEFGKRRYRLELGGRMEAYLDNQRLFVCSRGFRIATDEAGQVLWAVNIEEKPLLFRFEDMTRIICRWVKPNEKVTLGQIIVT